MPGPWRRLCCIAHERLAIYFNLRRDARPLATHCRTSLISANSGFQSQTRCQTPGDNEQQLSDMISIIAFNLRRKPRPLPTWDATPSPASTMTFNLRRDARPLATSCTMDLQLAYAHFQSQTRCQAPGDMYRTG